MASGKAGAIFALEVSRLARCSQDWQRLLALCAVAHVVVVDEQAIYDAQNVDELALLGQVIATPVLGGLHQRYSRAA